MNGKPSVLRDVERQTHKSYGERIGGKSRIVIHEPKPILAPIFENVGVCWACGKTRHVNAFGFCEECWITHWHACEIEADSQKR